MSGKGWRCVKGSATFAGLPLYKSLRSITNGLKTQGQKADGEKIACERDASMTSNMLKCQAEKN